MKKDEKSSTSRNILLELTSIIFRCKWKMCSVNFLLSEIRIRIMAGEIEGLSAALFLSFTIGSIQELSGLSSSPSPLILFM